MTKSATPKVLSDAQRKTAPKVAVGKTRPTNGKASSKVGVGEARDASPKPAPKVAVGEARDAALKPAPKVASEKASNAQSEAFRDVQVPSSMHALAERNVAQTRELYERSTNTLRAVLDSWEKCFGAAGEGAVALNHKIIDIAERNINTSFDLAAKLAGTKNLAEIIELQAAHWRKQFGDLSAQAEELRALSTEVSSSVAEPIRAQVTRMGKSVRSP
jgi:hypothetical protein